MSTVNKFEINGQEVLIDDSKLTELEVEVNGKSPLYAEQEVELPSGSAIVQIPYTIPSGVKIIFIEVTSSTGTSYNSVTGRTNSADSSYQNLFANAMTNRDINYIKCVELGSNTGVVKIKCFAERTKGLVDEVENIKQGIDDIGVELQQQTQKIDGVINGIAFQVNINEVTAVSSSYMERTSATRIVVRKSGTSTFTLGNFKIEQGKTYNVSIPKTGSSYGCVWAVTNEPIVYSDTTQILEGVYCPSDDNGDQMPKVFTFTNDSSLTNLVIAYDSRSGVPVVITEFNVNGLVKDEQEIGKLANVNLKAVNASIGISILSEKADTLSSGSALTIPSYPFANKARGESFQFHTKVSSFNKLSIGKGNWKTQSVGFVDYKNSWVEIDNTNIKLYTIDNTAGGDANKVLQETIAHGLTISDFIHVNINCLDDYRVHVRVMTNSSNIDSCSFDCYLTKWLPDACGIVTARNDGSVLADSKLSVADKYMKSPFWIFGASYECLNWASFWQYWVNKMGYNNYLVNSYPGRGSYDCFVELEKALQFGCPKYLFWTMWGNGSATNLDTYIGVVKSICDANKTTLIIIDRPNSTAINVQETYSARKSVIEKYKSMGVRYVDAANALSSNPSSPNGWYNGFLASDGIHTSALGAQALAMQVLSDVPEIMQYGINDNNEMPQ